MEAAAFADYLKNRYQDQLDYYEKASGKNQKKYKNFQWLLIILSTLTTILAALPSDKLDLKYTIVVSAGLVTILSSALKTFQYQELWVSYRATIEQLKPEIFYYKFSVGDYGQEGVDKESLFVFRIEGILNKEHDAWPVYKKLLNADGKEDQQHDALQKKLDELAREKFKTQKAAPITDKPPAGEKPIDTKNEPEQTNKENTTDTNDLEGAAGGNSTNEQPINTEDNETADSSNSKESDEESTVVK